MSTSIIQLMTALKNEVDRITDERASNTDKEELSQILIESINKTMREIKMGADSSDFQELTIINFVINADEAGFSTEIIREFVKELTP